MPNTLQEFLAEATQKAAVDLAEALLRLPEDKRNWCPGGEARTALNLVAECALLNGYTAELLQTRQWNPGHFADYIPQRDALIDGGWDALHARLLENTLLEVSAIRAMPDAALSETIAIPSGTETIASLLAYAYWNMTYHMGQINYIASMLGSSG